jgi:hypothetical protein
VTTRLAGEHLLDLLRLIRLHHISPDMFDLAIFGTEQDDCN